MVKNKVVDVVVIGAGAAGMMCAGVAGQRGRRVLLIDHAEKLAEKIRISGGGRCNFTNLHTSPQQFLSENPHFCRSALARYTAQDFLKLVQAYGIRWHEKHKGQLFCDESSQSIIDLLASECDKGGVEWWMPSTVLDVTQQPLGHWLISTDRGLVEATSVVIATGGMSIPKIGATDFGLKIAKAQGLKLIDPRPALVPLTFSPETWAPFVALAGVSLEVNITSSQGGEFREDLLFTHRGLSGPAVLQISSYWQHGDQLEVDLVPDVALEDYLVEHKPGNRQHVANVLAHLMPRKLAEFWVTNAGLEGKHMADVSDKALRSLANSLKHWKITPNGSEGFKKAEVMRGGVDTRQLDSKTMMAKHRPGLYFVGEVMDVTGWLGGYNFQWAWASGQAAGLAV